MVFLAWAKAGNSINTKPLNPMQRAPDQGRLLDPPVHELATNPITRIPGGALCLPNKHKESESVLHGQQPSFHEINIFRKHLGKGRPGQGLRGGGKGERAWEAGEPEGGKVR